MADRLTGRCAGPLARELQSPLTNGDLDPTPFTPGQLVAALAALFGASC